MSNIIFPVTFINGIDTDTESKFVKLGSSNYRLNCDISIQGKKGVVVNSNGNELVPFRDTKFAVFDLPAGPNEVIGRKEILETNSIIYFICCPGNRIIVIVCIIHYRDKIRLVLDV